MLGMRSKTRNENYGMIEIEFYQERRCRAMNCQEFILALIDKNAEKEK